MTSERFVWRTTRREHMRIGWKLQMDGDKRGKNPAQLLKLWSDWGKLMDRR